MARAPAQRKKTLPRYNARRGRWIGGDSRTLYTFTGRQTGGVGVYPGGGVGTNLLMNWGPDADVRVATRAEAEEHWQNPLHVGWKVAEDGSHHAHHATKRKYSPKTSEKVGRTMHEWKRGKLKSGSGAKVTSRSQAVAIGLSQARRKGYKAPSVPSSYATMNTDARVRVYLGNMQPGQEIDARGISRAIGVSAIEADYALERAAKAGHAVTSDGRWFGPAVEKTSSHARRKKYPYIAYWVHTRGHGGRESEAIYVLGTTTRADEGLIGHDLRARPLRLGKGTYTMVISPDDVEAKP